MTWQPSWLPGFLVVNGFALPLACFRDRFLKGLCQFVNTGYIVAIDGPCLGFFLGCSRFTINCNADAFPVGEKFLFDTAYPVPGQFDHFSVTAAFDQCL